LATVECKEHASKAIGAESVREIFASRACDIHRDNHKFSMGASPNLARWHDRSTPGTESSGTEPSGIEMSGHRRSAALGINDNARERFERQLDGRCQHVGWILRERSVVARPIEPEDPSSKQP